MNNRDLETTTPGLRCYVAVSAVLGSLMIGQTINQLWSTPDFWVYLGAVREFAARPLHPLHPLLVGDIADPYMGPYTWALGLITRVTSADPVVMFGFAGLLNVVLLLFGLWRFTRRFSNQPLAPTLSLLFMLLAWGWAPWRWSGYFNLNSIGSGLPLGSTFATAIGLFVLTGLVDWLRNHDTRTLSLAAVGYSTVVLTHQMTGLWVGLVGLGFVIAASHELKIRDVVSALVALAVSALLVVVWPFFSVLDLLRATGDFDAINARTYRLVAVRCVLALPGFVLLAQRLRRRPLDGPALAASLVAIVFVFGWLTDRGSLGRVFPGLMLMAHVTMADWFAARVVAPDDPPSVRRRTAMAVGFILIVGLAGTATGLVRGVPRALLPSRLADDDRLASGVTPYVGFADVLPSSAVVAAPKGVSLAVGAIAAKVIASPIPAPFVDDNIRRLSDNSDILDPATTATRRGELLALYGCEWLVVATVDTPALLSQLDGATVAGQVAGYTVIRLPSATATP